MSGLGFVGIMLGLLAIRAAFLEATRGKVAFFVGAYALHVSAAIIYWRMGETTQIDSLMYYYDPLRNFDRGFALGTQFVIWATQNLKAFVGGTLLDYFLLFQAIGFLGICVLMRTFEEIYAELKLPEPVYPYLLVVLPSLHFWSAALGKDAPYLLATTLAVWACMRLPRRSIALGAALLLMLLIRPHTALISVAALALATVIGRGMPGFARVGLFIVSVIGMGFAATLLQSTYNIDVTSAESIAQQFERRDSVLDSADAGNTAVTGSFAVRLFSLLFRPFFFDAQDSFALVLSFENLLIFGILAMMLVRTPDLLRLFRRVFYVRYALALSFAMILFLTISYWNVGLGLRQKWVMLMPVLLVIFVTIQGLRRSRSQQAESAPVPVPHRPVAVAAPVGRQVPT